MASKSLVQWLLLRFYFFLEWLRKGDSNKAGTDTTERFSQLVKPHLVENDDSLEFNSDINSILIFAPTIGELRASGYLLEHIKEQHQNYRIILMPGKEQYLQQYAALYPDEMVLSPDCNEYLAVDTLFDCMGITHMVLVEGPSLMGRFPTWLSLAFPVVCLKRRIPISVVNACMYKPEHQNLMARTRTKIFAPLHKYAIDHWYTADEGFSKDLSKAGVPSSEIEIVGDIKFDSIIQARLEKPSEELEALLETLRKGGGPLVIAGSMTIKEEIEFVISGWLQLKVEYPNAKLVIAPRYIREEILMNTVTNALEQQNIKYTLRTKDGGRVDQADAIVLDTYGELPHLYSVADIVFAGRDHGVLEPLRFNKPVIVGPHEYWNSDYSTSYSLYEFMSNSDALVNCESYTDLGDHMIRLIENKPYKEQLLRCASAAVNAQLGASHKIVQHLQLT